MVPPMRSLPLLLVCSTSLAVAAPAKKVVKIPDLSVKYLDGLFRFRPHLATFMGDHRFDRELADFSEEACLRRANELVELGSTLDAATGKGQKLSLDDQIDVEILKDAIALERLYLDKIRDWEWDPRLYDSFPYYDPRETFAQRLSDLMHNDAIPLAERKQTVRILVDKLDRFLPIFEKRLLKNAARVPKLYVERAIAGSKGRSEFLKTEVRDFLGPAAAPDKPERPLGARNDEFTTFLEKELLPKASGDWRLGKEVYKQKFRYALGTDQATEDAAASALRSFNEARDELYLLARKLWPRVLGSKEPLPAETTDKQQRAKLIERVKDELAREHAAPEALVAAHARNLDRMRDFIVRKDLLDLPPKETLTVEPMPLYKRGSQAAEYLAPGVLEKRGQWKATYFVDPIDPTWAKDRVESYLRGQNDYAVQLVAIHEAYPGHHTQFFYSKKSDNPLRAVLWNAPMVEGWAVYGEGQMVKAGWGDDKNDAFRLFELRGQMIVATNLLLDVKLHQGEMSDEEAVRFMVEEGFQEKAMAEKKLLRAKLDSTQLPQYFLGLDEIRRLEASYRKKVGDKFRQRAFNEAVIGHGSIAVRFLGRYLDGK